MMYEFCFQRPCLHDFFSKAQKVNQVHFVSTNRAKRINYSFETLKSVWCCAFYRNIHLDVMDNRIANNLEIRYEFL